MNFNVMLKFIHHLKVLISVHLLIKISCKREELRLGGVVNWFINQLSLGLCKFRVG
jgi:hypothetical protein